MSCVTGRSVMTSLNQCSACFFFSGGTKNYNMSSVCCEVSHPVTDVTGFVLHLTTLLSVLDSIHTLSGPVAPASLHKDRVGVLCR